jgi:pyruvate carboxylase subunit B
LKKKVNVKFGEKTYEVEVFVNQATSTNVSMTVIVEGKKYDVNVNRKPIIGEEKKPPTKPLLAKPSEKEFIVKSPLPGKILSVSVSPGKEVLRGDILLVMESMKMENEIRSPIRGIVKEVKVTVGQNVSTEDPLLVLVRSE